MFVFIKLQATNYSIGNFPKALSGRNGQQIYEGDLQQIKGYAEMNRESKKNNTCFIHKFHPPQNSQWIAVILEARGQQSEQGSRAGRMFHRGCSTLALLTYAISSTNASVILFLHNQDSKFNLAGISPSCIHVFTFIQTLLIVKKK